MSTRYLMGEEAEIKRVGKSGQISVGKQYAGRYFREELRDDGAIVLTPVAVLPESHWTVRDRAKIVEALEWASKTPPRESDVDELVQHARKAPSTSKRGR
jgi:hypothetical protein